MNSVNFHFMMTSKIPHINSCLTVVQYVCNLVRLNVIRIVI